MAEECERGRFAIRNRWALALTCNPSGAPGSRDDLVRALRVLGAPVGPGSRTEVLAAELRDLVLGDDRECEAGEVAERGAMRKIKGTGGDLWVGRRGAAVVVWHGGERSWIVTVKHGGGEVAHDLRAGATATVYELGASYGGALEVSAHEAFAAVHGGARAKRREAKSSLTERPGGVWGVQVMRNV